MGKKAKILITLLVACLYFVLLHMYSPSRSREDSHTSMYSTSDGPTMEIDGVKWTEVLSWDFSDGPFPTGWGWGEWDIVDGLLEGRDPEGTFAVYFFPYTHGGNALLETKVQLVEGSKYGDVEAHLLTRDTDDLNFESGFVLLANNSAVHLRHMAGKTNYIYDVFEASDTTLYGEWYVMQFVIHRNKIKAYLNGIEIDSRMEGVPDVLPVGVYREPHLSVTKGTARFEYVKIFIAPE